MPYTPKHQPQLGRGVPVPGRTQGSRDCGPRTWQMGVDWSTRGVEVPGIVDLRDRGNCEGPVPTNTSHAQRSVESFNTAAELGGVYRDIPYSSKEGASMEAFFDALKNDRYVFLCTMYGPLNRLQPGKSGDPNFNDGHSIGVLGQRLRDDGKWVVLSFDSLFDGRRAEIPKGPQWLLRSTVIAMMQAYSGNSTWWGGVFRPAIPKGNSPALYDEETLYLTAQRNDLEALISVEDESLRRISEEPKVPADIRQAARERLALIRQNLDGGDDPTDEPEEGIEHVEGTVDEDALDDIIAEAERLDAEAGEG